MEQGDDEQLLSINKKIRINKHVVILEEEEYTTELLVLNKKKKTDNNIEKRNDYSPQLSSEKQINGHKRTSICKLNPCNDINESKDNFLSSSVRINNKGQIKEQQDSKNNGLNNSAVYSKPIKSNGKIDLNKSRSSFKNNSNEPSSLINKIFKEQDSYNNKKFEDIANKLIIQLNNMTSPLKRDPSVANKPQTGNLSNLMISNKGLEVVNPPVKSNSAVVFNSKTTKNSKTKKSRFFCCLPIF